jgi:ribose transport system permease protein
MLARLRDYGIVAFLLLLVVVMSLTTDTFLTVDNIKNVLNNAAAVGIIACAITLVIIAGGFDLSAGAMFTVAAIIAAKVANETSIAVGIVAGLAAGAGLGLVNGLLCTVGRLNHFVGTLGTMIAFGGLATLLSGAGMVLIDDQSFADVANTELLGFRMSTWALVAVALLLGYLLNRTVFGRHIFGTGGNFQAARLAGVPVFRTQALTYVISGVAAAVAGILVAAETLSVTDTGGAAIIFDALAAVLIGGNSVRGGEGAIWRTMVGVLVLGVIANGFNLNGVDPIYQQIVSGTIIIVAVGADAWTRRRSA